MVIILIITIISKAQILKKLSTLYKEHDGNRKLVDVHVQKSNKESKKQTYTLSHTAVGSMYLYAYFFRAGLT